MIALSRRIMISASREAVRGYLRELGNLSDYEKKVNAVTVVQQSDEAAEIDVQGRFIGLPWKGGFNIAFTKDGGFRSEMVRGPLRKMTGGFHLRQVPGGTVLTHDESYQLPIFMRPFTSFIRKWLNRSMEKELFAIKEGAEALNRRLQLEQIESQGLLEN